MTHQKGDDTDRVDAKGTRVVVLAGGFGGSKMAHGLALVAAREGWAGGLAVVVNVGDDVDMHGLRVSPDLDTVMYTLAGMANPDTGWGIEGDTWSAAEMLERYGQPTWFKLGDTDLATAILRTEKLRGGGRLTDVVRDLSGALEVEARILPATDHRVATQVRTDEGWLDFQDYFVRRHHEDDVREVRYAGIESARPTPDVRAAIAGAETVVIAPSNPHLSIDPILALDGVVESLRAAAAPVVAVSPLVGGKALRGPADRIFSSLGSEPSALGVAQHYQERYPALLDGLVIDTIDEHDATATEATGVAVLATDTIMRTYDDRARLAAEVLEFARSLRSR
jgi:LPPG:FO 2-phospho-L-lactate transferase